jgi:hypothetical protein
MQHKQSGYGEVHRNRHNNQGEKQGFEYGRPGRDNQAQHGHTDRCHWKNGHPGDDGADMNGRDRGVPMMMVVKFICGQSLAVVLHVIPTVLLVITLRV